MIKHIVFWRLNEAAYGNDKQINTKLLQEKLLAMDGKVDDLQKLKLVLISVTKKIPVMLYYTLSLKTRKHCVDTKSTLIMKQ